MNGSDDIRIGDLDAFLDGRADEGARQRIERTMPSRDEIGTSSERPSSLTSLLDRVLAERRVDHVTELDQQGPMPSQATDPASPSRSRFFLGWRAGVVALAAIVLVGGPLWLWSIRPTPTSTISSVSDSLGTVTRTASGEVEGLEAFPDQWRQDVQLMLASGHASASPIALSFRDHLRGGEAGAYLQPLNTVVLSTTPRFSWVSYGEGTSYEVVLIPQDEALAPVRSGVLMATTWTVPATSPLARGAVYAWEIVVHSKGKEYVPDEPRPRFKILSSDALAAVESAAALAHGSHLLLAAAYLDSGLLDDADRELTLCVAENPDSVLARDLLQSLRLQR